MLMGVGRWALDRSLLDIYSFTLQHHSQTLLHRLVGLYGLSDAQRLQTDSRPQH